jgi:hypothetical protein
MYLYLLPLSSDSSAAAVSQEMTVPTPDGGVEHTAAKFDNISAWLARANAGEVIILPPQAFLLTLLSQFLTPSSNPSSSSSSPAVPSHAELQSQRSNLITFLKKVPSATATKASKHPTAQIPWAEKVICPHVLFMRKADNRVVLGLDQPGPELVDSGRGGDWERVVLAHISKAGVRGVEVRDREEVFDEERRAEKDESEKL